MDTKGRLWQIVRTRFYYEGEPLKTHHCDLRSSDHDFHLQRTVLYSALVPGAIEPLEILKILKS